ncbi:4'-phosphopantetheinyl transferase family protein [Lysinibacillus sp. NPDC096418]|uniref:4'-phosphopantetheinyl transferase family protein n=1 Tax=Lysinibacillus sp. NPDC096418 TaxID=3364138 RepID=UPI00380B5940
MVEVYLCRLPKVRDDTSLHQLLRILSSEKQNRIKKMKFLDDQYRSLIGELLIRYIASKKLALTNEDFKFSSNSFGKPFIQSYPSFHYNIAHSGEWVVCAIHNEEVGIDIEMIKPIDKSSIYKLLEGEEVNYITKKKTLAAFYDIWTLKESYVKAIGKGLSLPLQSFLVRIKNEDQIDLIDRKDNNIIENAKCTLYKMCNGYRLSTCIIIKNNALVQTSYNYLSFEKIYNRFFNF